MNPGREVWQSDGALVYRLERGRRRRDRRQCPALRFIEDHRERCMVTRDESSAGACQSVGQRVETCRSLLRYDTNDAISRGWSPRFGMVDLLGSRGVVGGFARKPLM